MSTIDPQTYKLNSQAALQWIRKSLDVHQGKGSAAFYSRRRYPLKGWAPPYPETTGYLIETLYKYQEEADWIKEAIPTAVQWLLSVQMPSGAFPALYANSGKPSIFNSGMILFGLAAAYEATPTDQLLQSIRKTINWIIQQLQPDATWAEAGSPTYYSRVIWALLICRNLVPELQLEATLSKTLDAYLDRVTSSYSFRRWGFKGDEQAFTHTIAYTLRGFWEAGQILQNQRATLHVTAALDRFQEGYKSKGIAGQYNLDWTGNHRFQCLPGNLQLAILCFRVGEEYRETGNSLIDETLRFQQLNQDKKTFGALAGSKPFSGKYMSNKYPNWSVKFLLDALWEVYLD